jgi:16S rRNA (guanine(966)-N(2))-methyltransferase RsmD
MRIIAGEFKNMDLLAPPDSSPTRPITGHVKKSLFGMLGEDLTGQVVLDLYCGTGTLGIEALSRGASRCCFAEKDRRALDCLRQNIRKVRAEARCVVWGGDVQRRLASDLAALQAPVDLAFVDPPYAAADQWDWLAVTRQIFDPLAGSLAAQGVVVLRTSDRARIPETIGSLAILRQRRYGDMVLTLLGKAGEI